MPSSTIGTNTHQESIDISYEVVTIRSPVQTPKDGGDRSQGDTSGCQSLNPHEFREKLEIAISIAISSGDWLVEQTQAMVRGGYYQGVTGRNLAGALASFSLFSHYGKEHPMWFHSWPDILRVLLVGSASYVVLVLVLRASGKRTLSQLNAFDFIVTVALGSTLATILLSAEVSWAEGLAALALLAAMQFFVAWLSARWPRVRSLVTAKPVVLVIDGELQLDQLRSNRLTASEVFQAVRSVGSGDLSDVAAVVLETNGTLSVISASRYGSGSALEGVLNRPERQGK